MPSQLNSRFRIVAFCSVKIGDPRSLRLGFVGILAIVLVGTSLQYFAKIAKPGDSGQQTRSAFLRWRALVLEAFDGANVYTGLNEYPNPPIMAIVLRPFAELPPVAGAMAWFYAKVGMAILAALWIFRLVATTNGSVRSNRELGAGSEHDRAIDERVEFEASDAAQAPSELAKAIAILFALPAIVGDLTHNNINIFILFLLAAALELYRRKRDTSAGLVLGLAIACKVTPLLFLAYFGWKRAWRVVTGCLLGLLLWLVIVPGCTFGFNHNSELLTDWYKLMVERPILKGEIATERANQAIPGFIYRVFTHSPSAIEFLDLGPNVKIPQAAAYHNIADIGRPVAWWVVKGLTAAFALAIVLLCPRNAHDRRGWRFAAECSLIALGMLLFSERTWKHHAVTLLMPAAVLASSMSLPFAKRIRALLLTALGLAWCVMVLPSLLGSRASEFAMIYGGHTLAFALLSVATCALLGSSESTRSSVATDELCGLGRTDGLDNLEGKAKLG
jgi:hypothetical protein